MMDQLPKQMIDTYLLRRINDLKKLQAALKNNSIEVFNRIGHQLAGNASSFGFPDLEPLARKMERLNIKDLPAVGPELVHEFSVWIKSQKI